MWISGLEGLSFYGFLAEDGNRLFDFDVVTGEYTEVLTEAGEAFTPYGGMMHYFGKDLVSGGVGSTGVNAVGHEVYERMPDGTLALFADIVPGEGSSFFRIEDAFQIEGSTHYIIDSVGTGFGVAHVLFSTGVAVPLADYFPTVSVFSNFWHPMSVDGATIFLAKPDGSVSVPWRLDIDAGTYEALVAFDRSVGGYKFNNLYHIGDTLYAQVTTSLHGKELWALSPTDTWELVKDIAPGSSSSGPSFEFEFNGEAYFTAVNDTVGRELYRIDDTGSMSLVADLAPGSGNGVYFTRDIEINGVLYFESNVFDTLYSIDNTGALTEVTEFIPGQVGGLPQSIINLDTGAFVRFRGDRGEDGTDYIVRDGVIMAVEFPEGDVNLHGIFNGNLIIEVEADGQNSVTLYVLSETDQWVPLFTSPGLGNDRVIGVTQLEFDADARDIYFGTEDDELIAIPDVGGIVSASGGNDTIKSGVGNDILSGGAGHDTFVFAHANDADTISDFITGEDMIDVSSLIRDIDFVSLIAIGAGEQGQDVRLDHSTNPGHVGSARITISATQDGVDTYLSITSTDPIMGQALADLDISLHLENTAAHLLTLDDFIL